MRIPCGLLELPELANCEHGVRVLGEIESFGIRPLPFFSYAGATARDNSRTQLLISIAIQVREGVRWCSGCFRASGESHLNAHSSHQTIG